jgi:hypothetical protein
MKYNISCKIIAVFCVLAVSAAEAKPAVQLPYFAYEGKRLDAKAVGMGETFVSIADNASAAYWNPAGLKQLSRNYFSACVNVRNQSNAQSADIYKNDSLGSKKLLMAGIAAKEGAFMFRPISDFSTTYGSKEIKLKANKYTLSTSSRYSEDSYLGLNMSYISGQMAVVDRTALTADVSQGNGVSLDWGFLYNLGDSVKLGFDIENAPGIIWWDEYRTQSLKSRLQTGFSVTPAGFLVVAVEYENKNVDFKRKDFYHLGLEQVIVPGSVFLREGASAEDPFDNSSEDNVYTGGVGFVLNNGLIIDISARVAKVDNTDKDKTTDYLLSLGFPF